MALHDDLGKAIDLFVILAWSVTNSSGSTLWVCPMGVSYGACLHNSLLTHWGRVTHTCVGNLTIIGSDNGLSPGRRRAIIWINAGILLNGPLGINFSEILIEIHA